MDNQFFDDFLNEIEAANLQAQGDMSIIDFANRIIFNNDQDFQLYPTQKAILKSFYNEELTPEEEGILNTWVEEERSTWVPGRKYISLVLEAGRRASKALDLNTLIETPKGTKIFKDIHIGDYVFDPEGNPVKVINETPLYNNHKIYRLHFSDGSTIDSDAGHLWRTWDKAARKAYGRSKNPTVHPQIRTTQHIVDTLHIKRKDGRVENNHSIELAKPLKYPKQNLLIHPFILGYWLGDETAIKGEITSSKEDINYVFKKFEKLGYKPYYTPTKDYKYRLTSDRLSNELKELGLINNKHIPNNYIYSSLSQRIYLLKGLMDTNGTVCKKGKATFINTNFNLTDAVFKIANSLGCVATQSQYQGKCNSKLTKLYREVRLRLSITPFSLPRKIARYKLCTAQNNKRFITAAELIPSRPVKCITVEGGLFLVGNNIITHNCNASSAYIPTTVGEITYGKLYQLLSQGEKVGIMTYDINGEIPKQFITYDIKAELNAVEKVYKITTSSGRTEIVNENHPFLQWGFARKKWRKLKDLKQGDMIATSAALPIFGIHEAPDSFLRAVAFSLCAKPQASPNIYKTAIVTFDEIHHALSYFNTRDYKILTDHTVKFMTSRYNKLQYIITPELIGGLDKESQRKLLRYIIDYSYIFTPQPHKEKYIGFNIKLNKLQESICRAFIRFGCNFSINKSGSKYDLYLGNDCSLLTLYEEFGWDIRGNEEHNRTFCAAQIKAYGRNSSDSLLPHSALYYYADDSTNPTIIIDKPTVKKVAIDKKDPYHFEMTEGPINWENITSIEPYGTEQTIALEVADTHVIGSYIISHNSTMASIIALKEFYDSHKHYGMFTGSPIAILVMAQSQAQVKETIFAAIRGYAENSHFFTALKQRGDIEILSEEIRCPAKNVAIYAKHTNSKSLVGYTLKCMLLDEVARFETTGDEGKNKAFEIWRNVAAGGAAFGTSFKKVAISSAWEPGDPIEVLYEDAKRDPNTLGFKLTTFQVNLQLIKGVTPVIVSDYTTDYVKARREYEGVRFSKFNAFIDLLNLQRSARGISCIDAQPCEIDVESKAGTRHYAGVDIIRLANNPNPENLSFIHVDPALKKDSAALAIARPHKEEDKWKIQIDGLLKWEPHTDKKGLKRIVSYIDIEERLDDLCPARCVSRVTFDQWNCYQYNQLIKTPKGLIRVKDIKVGEEVISKDGINKVIKTEKKKNVPTLKVITKNGYEIEATYNHPVLNKEDKFIEIKDLKIGDKLKLYIPETKEVNKEPFSKQEHEALVLGYLIAEGDWNYYAIRFSNTELEVQADYLQSYEYVTQSIPNVRHKYISESNKEYHQRLTQELDLQTGAFNKKLPEYIFTASRKEIGLMLSGLYEGDGNVTCFIPTAKYKKQSPRIYVELTTVSEQLSKDVQQMLLYLGIKSNRKKYSRKTPKGQLTFYYRILVYGQNILKFKKAISFRSTRKKDALDKAILHLSFARKSRVNYSQDTIVSIKATTSTIMHMEVSGDHTYCSEFINHNSASFIQKLHAKGIDAQQVSCSREMQFAYYTLFRDLLAHDYIILPRDSLWTNDAITELSELVLKPNRQIIHPYAGKDIADAIVNAVYQCHQYMVRTGLNITTGLNTGVATSQNLATVQRLNMSGNKIQIGSAINRLYNHKSGR